MNIDIILAGAGLRNTRQRRLILELLIKEGSPLSHSEILAKIDEHLDRVTLYRTLETLKECGLVHQVQGIDGVWRFCAHSREIDGCPGDHAHFLCLSCGKMICLPEEKMPRVNVPGGVSVEGKQFVVYGKCGEGLQNDKDRGQE